MACEINLQVNTCHLLSHAQYACTMKRLLNTNELALELNKSARQIRYLVDARKIPVLRIGYRTNLFDLDKVLKALARFEIPEVSAK